MNKSSVVKLFWGSVMGLAVGGVLLVLAAAFGLGANVLVMSGPDVTGVRGGPAAWATLGVAAFALLLILASSIVQFAAWVIAVINTANLPDKRWCIGLLIVGVLGLFLLATLAYVISGPEAGTADVAEAGAAARRRPGGPASVTG